MEKPIPKLNVLVACESSGVVREAFRALGHNAWSCDLLPADDGSPYHIPGDVLGWLRSVPEKFKLGIWRRSATETWDLLIGHPPCTFMCNSGVRWLVGRAVLGESDIALDRRYARWKDMEKAAQFFAKLYLADIPYIAIENPIMHRYAAIEIAKYARLHQPKIKATQFVQPWMFGHGETKATGLWLKNLPKLVATDLVSGREHRVHRMPPGPNRWKERSKTFEGIAKAMAAQWSAHIIAEKQKG